LDEHFRCKWPPCDLDEIDEPIIVQMDMLVSLDRDPVTPAADTGQKSQSTSNSPPETSSTVPVT